MKRFKKIISVIIIAIIVALSVVPAFAIDITELTFFYIDKGNITIDEESAYGFGAYGERVEEFNPNGYCITAVSSGSTSNTVTVSSGECNILLRNVNIAANNQFKCSFLITGGAKVNLYLEGVNNITSGSSRAGIEISTDSTLEIFGDGTLNVSSYGQAGIGGGNGASNGTVIINSGIINASSNSDSAGIGGGSSGNGGNITINGGVITATGGAMGAGIGGGVTGAGGNITINGGVVTATGGENGAGIGGGWYGEMGSVTINGGSIKAVAGSGTVSIGSGNGATPDYPVDSNGEQVYLTKINVGGMGLFNQIYSNGKSNNITSYHPDDSYFYFYFSKGTNFVAIEPNGAKVSIYRIDTNQNGSSAVSAVNPVTAFNGATIGNDNIIRGITCGLTNLDGYLQAANGYSFSYDNEFIGTGTNVTLMFGDKPVYSYKALLYGDLNNDGFYDGEDSFIVLLILWDKLTKKNTDPIIFEAADVDRDNYIGETDLNILQRAGLLLQSVDFNNMTLQSDAYCEYISLVSQSAPQEIEPEIQEGIAEQQPEEISILQKIVIFIKNALKLLISVNSFWNK